MNTHGHESIAKAVGNDVLEKAFGPRMKTKPRMEAFYLGNWIADVGQLVDPILENNVYTKGVNIIADTNAWISEIFLTVMNWCSEARRLNKSQDKDQDKSKEKWSHVPLKTLVDLESKIAKLGTEISGYFADFLNEARNPKKQEGNRRYTWNYMLLQPAFLLKGYLKFVHPLPGTNTPRMDLAAYLHVFDELFEQYFPHEHFDRPWERQEVNFIPTRVPYDTLVAKGPRTLGMNVKPDLYDYLRDDLEIVAMRLTELDIGWARKYLQPASAIFQDNDLEWNLGLAKLGYAVHGIEDFFAHSNFIEHAAKVMGGKHIPWFFQVVDNRRFLKRLKKYDFKTTLSDDEWEQLPDEENIVTGFFDTVDTKFSLLHLAESAFEGFADIDATRHLRYFIDWNLNADRADEEAVTAIDETIQDFLKFIHDPKAADEDNIVMKAIRAVMEATGLKDVDELMNALRQSPVRPDVVTKLREHLPLLRQIDALQGPGGPYKPEQAEYVIERIFEYLRRMTMLVKVGQTGYTYYKLYREILKFCANPTAWILEKLEEQAVSYLVNAGLFLAKEHLWMKMGLERIGCHSLLSKDHGPEWLYKPMKNCASAVHYYIVKTMMRWGEPGYDATPENEKYVDWLALLEHFTLHPAANLAPCTTPLDIGYNGTYQPNPTELQQGLKKFYNQLVDQFRLKVLDPNKLTVSEIMKSNLTPLVRRKRQYALAESVALTAAGFGGVVMIRRVIIPSLKAQLKICSPADLPQNERWYFKVIESGWKVAQTAGWPEPGNPILFRTDVSTVTNRIQRGEVVLTNWKSFYRPENEPKP